MEERPPDAIDVVPVHPLQGAALCIKVEDERCKDHNLSGQEVDQNDERHLLQGAVLCDVLEAWKMPATHPVDEGSHKDRSKCEQH